MPFVKRSIILLFALLAADGCTWRVDREAQEIARHASLARLYAARFPVGAAVEPAQLDTREGKLLAWHFNSVVAENAMKMPRLQPAEGRFDFDGADRIVAFATERGMKVRGHTLLWPEETPEWLWRGSGGEPASRDVVRERLRSHIHAVVGRYRGRVYAWDVVNEAIDPGQPGCLRNDRWHAVLGPEYIEWAFRYAREADTGARLFLNDYETTDPARRACLLRVVTQLRARGVPVDGMGHQMHVELARPAVGEIEQTLAMFAALGVENQVTELDMTLGSTRPDAGVLARQAARYAELLAAFARAGVTAVTFWGISDANTWLNRRGPAGIDQPLLFDARQEPKPAYFAVKAVAP